jgi:hypothetical protein
MGKLQANPLRKRNNKKTEEDDGGSEQDEDEEDNEKSRDRAVEESGTQDLDPGTVPNNFTICSPQLLHFGTDGKPLWFNGWLLSNKFADKKKRKPVHSKYI